MQEKWDGSQPVFFAPPPDAIDSSNPFQILCPSCGIREDFSL